MSTQPLPGKKAPLDPPPEDTIPDDPTVDKWGVGALVRVAGLNSQPPHEVIRRGEWYVRAIYVDAEGETSTIEAPPGQLELVRAAPPMI